MRSSYPNINPNVDESRSVLQGGPQGVGLLPGYDNDALGVPTVMTLTDTISGVPVVGDTISLTLGGKYITSVTVPTGGATVNAVAAQLAAAFNAGSVADIARAVAASAIVTISLSGGLSAVGTDLTKVDGGGVVQTLSAAAFTGGTGPFIPRRTFTITTLTGPAKTPFTFTFREGKAYNLSPAVARAIFGS
jgi:hypothetical protein